MLDRLAISMAVICAIHCLVTPALLVALPIIATTFWSHENFHLWMLLLVLPTTGLAVYSGCRRHKDRWVMALIATGLCLLVLAYSSEQFSLGFENDEALEQPSTLVQSGDTPFDTHAQEGGCCSLHPGSVTSSDDSTVKESAVIPWHALLNTLGGLFLIAGHTRNFRLCRQESCRH
ncbi:MAG: MerC domain-containing protein [Puniceicoccales bacterium]